MKVFYILLNICLPYYSFVISTCTETSGSISISSSAFLTSSPTNSVCGSIFRCYILDTFFFGVGITSIFLVPEFSMVFFFLTPSSKVLWFFWLYLLLSYSIYEVLWFFSLQFFLLSCSIRPCFCLFILA